MVLSSASPRRGFNFALILSVIGVIVGGFALFLALTFDPNQDRLSTLMGGSVLGKYKSDLETPSGTAKALLQMENDGDIRALRAYEMQFRGKLLKEKLETFKVDEEVEFKLPAKKDAKGEVTTPAQEFKVLFVSYKQDSKDVKEVIVMEKFNEPLRWRKSDLEHSKIAAEDNKLGEKIMKWRV